MVTTNAASSVQCECGNYCPAGTRCGDDARRVKSGADQYVTDHSPDAGNMAPRADAARPVPAESCFLILFEDRDRPPEVFMLGGNAEIAARQRFEQVLGRGWNAHLFQRIDDGKRPLPEAS